MSVKSPMEKYLGNTKNGGIELPKAETAQVTVTSCPLSWEVIAPTCFLPLVATILSGRCTVVTPVSSMFQIACGDSLYFAMISYSKLKNFSTLCLLKLLARAIEVACGFLIDRLGLRFIKQRNQSQPAIFFSAQLLGVDSSKNLAYWNASCFVSVALSPK